MRVLNQRRSVILAPYFPRIGLIVQCGVALTNSNHIIVVGRPSLISNIRSCKLNNRRAVSAKLKAVAAKTSLIIKRLQLNALKPHLEALGTLGRNDVSRLSRL